MKKIKILVASAIMSTLISTTAFAALPGGTVIIGDKAYDISYISNNVKSLDDIINNSSSFNTIYYDDGTSITDLFAGNTTTTEAILSGAGSLTYYSSTGVKSIYTFDKTNNVFNMDSSSSTVEAKIKVTSMSNMYFVSITVPDSSKVNLKPYTLQPTYFKVNNNNNSDLIKKIGTPNTTNGETNDDYVLNLVTTDPNIRLQLLSSDKMTIATTESKALQSGLNTVDFKLDSNFIDTTSTTTTSTSEGNGLGNLNNTGITAASGDWTYYSNPADGGGIYKTNGTESQKICNDNAKFINVVGDWIYYSNYSDGQKIYKVRTDGTGRRIVCTDQASYIVVSGEDIYYSYHSGTGNGNIRKVNRDAIKSTGTNISNDEAEYLFVLGDTIYFTNISEGNAIYAVHTDGTYKTRISSDNARFITYANNKIYYITNSGQLKWTNSNGGSYGSTAVSNGNTGSSAIISSMNITNDGKWMYYTDASDSNKIYRAPLVDYLKISGDKYSDSSADFINLIGDTVYYTNGKGAYIAAEPKISSSSSSTTGKATYTYTSTALAKPKQSLKIVSYDKTATPTKSAVGSDLSNLEEYLPDKVTAVMSDNSVHEVLVDWDLNPKQNTKGASVNYTGTLVGYGSKVALSLSMASEKIPAGCVKVINNAGSLDDEIYINKDDRGANMPTLANLQVGDVIKVYRDASKAELLGQDTIVPTVNPNDVLHTTITLRGSKTLTDDAKNVCVTRTSSGVLESDVTQVPITGALSGKPTFNASNVNVTITNYGKLPDGLTENALLEIAPTTEFTQGDVVNVYKEINGVKTLLGSQMVEYVPSTDPFAPNKYKLSMTLPAGYLVYDSDTTKDTVSLTRSTQFAESDPITASYGKGIALPLGSLTISGTSGNICIHSQLDTTYDYYYKVGGTGTAPYVPYLGDDVSGWTKITDPTFKIGVNANDDVYVVQAYKDTTTNTEKALRCSHATAQVH